MHHLPFRKKRIKPRPAQDESWSPHLAASIPERPSQPSSTIATSNADASSGGLPKTPAHTDDLWDQAYRVLQSEPDGKKLLARYEEILASELSEDEGHQSNPV